ncbi:uncharacterized protein AC631_05110 [Debaryomyces fabryi]|uniref:Alpha-1,2-mannosyltransferase MNN2 n=1 Tax=Debaryomyces fabryi TaxID=58627 RepID=A0A0V1PSC4_9ASCO|nr:uncharacterized protein AC631_05110 [Debaryomyces fabryi]KRZ99136.1 hypothetical protein AC631_05110 [Debaryomyces fabryi]CUM56745.1 unnamed protein product [Debaryomyces fabryi]
MVYMGNYLRSLRMKFALFGAVICLLILVTIHETSKEYYGLIPISMKGYLSNERNTGKDVENLCANNVKAQIFWGNLFETISANSLNLTNDELDNAITYNTVADRKETNTRDVLLSKADISEKAFKEFKEKHKTLLQELPSEIPTVAYKPGSNGIVFVGGGRFSWLSYLSLLGLRETGSKMPVEIIMPKYVDYEEEMEFCTEILPKLNAKCVVIPEIFGPSVMTKWNKKIKSYQFKSLALMVSSFQNVLLLDSDNIVIENPDPFFDSDLFRTYGMITWPDYWRRTISPHFYNIAGTEVNERKRVRYDRLQIGYDESDNNLQENEKDSVPFHDLDGAVPNLSTESGQLFINKDSHGKTLLLSLYYNLYGPKLYYKLFSLGELGEGDKDSFAAAATVLKQDFYQLKSSIKGIGHFDKDDHFQGKAMAQKNPLRDYEIFKERVSKPLIEQEKNKMPLNERVQHAKKVIRNHFTSNNDNPIFAMHCHYPKLDPADIMQRDSIYDKEEKRLHYRMYKGFSFERNSNEGNTTIDFELTQWTNMQRALCTEKLYFRHFGHDNQELCEFINNQVSWLSNS